MLLLNTLDLFCIQVGKCIWQDLDVAIHVYVSEVLRLRSRVRGLDLVRSRFCHITNTCRQSKLTLKM